jgi:hypothetical protein
MIGRDEPGPQHPPTDRLIADHQPALNEELDIPVAQGEPKKEPDSVPDEAH